MFYVYVNIHTHICAISLAQPNMLQNFIATVRIGNDAKDSVNVSLCQALFSLNVFQVLLQF